jgi:hypothetical protein
MDRETKKIIAEGLFLAVVLYLFLSVALLY